MPFHVLSLSGGGFLGYYTICVLAALEQRAGRPIGSCFDLVSGTSVGGIIALCLAGDVPARDIKRAFEQNGQRIFSNRPVAQSPWSGLLVTLRALYKSKYNSQALRDTIGAVVGHGTTLAQLKRRVLIPTVNLTDSRAHYFKTPHHASALVDAGVKVTDVAMATAAAPTYFSAIDIGDKLYTDGSLFLNTPDVMALHEATHHLGVDVADVRMLSIGTTTSRFHFPPHLKRNLGGTQWAHNDRLIKVIMAAQQSQVSELISHHLGDQHLRIDAVKTPAQDQVLSLDVATDEAMHILNDMAMASVREHSPNALLQQMLNYEAARMEFVAA